MHLPLACTLMILSRRGEAPSAGCGPIGCFVVVLVLGLVLWLVLRGRGDRRETLDASKRPMGSGPLQPVTFASPFPKCPNCGAAGDKLRQQWDGLRKVTWTCGYCGFTQVQELKDEELPASARQRLGLDPGPQAYAQGQPGYERDGGFGGAGGLITGMMLGSMLGGSHHHHDDGGWGGGSGDSGGDWGSGDSGGDSGGDWGGGDSGGDWGGGDSGGDW